MRTAYHYISDDEEEIIDHLVHEVRSVLLHHDYESLKLDLWTLVKVITSVDYKNRLQEDHTKTIQSLKELVEGAWKLLERTKRMNFEFVSLHENWANNPYRQLIKDRDTNDARRNSHLAPYSCKIQYLNKEEVRDFTIAIEDFFFQLNLLDWLKLLDKWAEYSTSNDSITSEGWDEAPLSTYEQIAKLIEVAYLVDMWYYNREQTSPNDHLFYNEETIFKLDPGDYDNYNPLEHINGLFADYTPKMLKKEINTLFGHNKAGLSESNSNMKARRLFRIANTIISLIEAGWLLTQSDEIPEYWLNPNRFEFYQAPRLAKTEISSPDEEDTRKSKSPQLILSKIYRRVGMYFYRYQVEEILRSAMVKEKKNHYAKNELRKKLFRLVDTLYLVNIEVCNRKTKESETE